MRSRPTIWLIVCTCCSVLLSGCATAPPGPTFFASKPEPAVAGQINWDWSGGNNVGGSGRRVVRFDSRFLPGEMVVSFGDRQLYFVTKRGEAMSYPIAIPREEDRWQGVTAVSDKKLNPSWTPTPTMIAENPRLPRWVPGGHPMNPLGVRALYLGDSFYRIHGTDAPWTIGSAISKGCIRMYNEDVVDLYPRVAVGAKVTVTWDRFNGAS
jgi:lipoprotein-anchoring transpeptidase ErfK/SrfK